MTAGITVTFLASATEPQGREMEFRYEIGVSPRVHALCDWGGPACKWVASPDYGVSDIPGQSEGNIVVLRVWVRTLGGANPPDCSQGGCHNVTVEYRVVPPPPPSPSP